MLIIGDTVAHYRILEKLGEGGMGVVYKAHDTRLDRTVALKFLPSGLNPTHEEKARFVQEARAASALNHPNVCIIHDIQEVNDQQFIVMEYVAGKTLKEMVPIRRLEDAIDYAIHITEALGEAHGKGIVHRDIKSENIMVNTKNQIKVLDFGLAKLRGSLKLTRTSSTLGTLAYMSPEQIRGEEVDARSDIFSFGVVLYEMLSGRLPFKGEHEAAMLYSIVNEEPEPIRRFRSDLAREVVDLLGRALEKDPLDRFQIVADVLIDLRRMRPDTSRIYISEHSARAAQIGTPIAGPERSLRRTLAPKLKWTLLSFAVVVALTGVYLYSWLDDHFSEHLRGKKEYTFRVLQIPFTEVSLPALSRDGNWAFFGARDVGGKWDVFQVNTTSPEFRRITFDSALRIFQVDLSPDGSQLVYDIAAQNDSFINVSVASVLGGKRRRIGIGIGPRWRPDGLRIGYIKGDYYAPSETGKNEFWTATADGREHCREFVDSAGTMGLGTPSFAWLPNGEAVGWIRILPGGHSELFVRLLAEGRERQITFDKKSINDVCLTAQNEMLFSSNRGGNSNIWMIPPDGGEILQITRGITPNVAVRTSAEGRKVLLLQQEQTRKVWIADLEGNKSAQVPTVEGLIYHASLSPDRMRLAFVMRGPDPGSVESSVFTCNRDGTELRKLASNASRPFWSPDGELIAYSATPPSPKDSSADRAVYVVHPLVADAPRWVSHGYPIGWKDPQTVIVYDGKRSLEVPLRGGTPRQVYKDSTRAVPILDGRHILFTDLRGSRRGLWIVSNLKNDTPRMISDKWNFSFNPDGRFVIVFDRGSLTRISLPDGRRRTVRRDYRGLTSESMVRVSPDGREIVYLEEVFPSKLVMIDDFN